jgi:nucleotide-binding universal stress UspA family protein
MTEILCTTDFSVSSQDALRWSIDLAKRLGAHITVLYTYRLFKRDGEIINSKRIIEEEALLNFGKLERELLAGAGVDYDFKSEVGFVTDRVEEHAKKRDVSFLVMGRGMQSLNKEGFDELVSHLRVPLVIVP